MDRLAVVFLTFNNEEHILNSITSVSCFEIPIFVVDSGSEDDTINIVKPFCEDVFIRKLNPWDAGNQRNYAYQKLKDKFKYLLFLDSDEIFTVELLKEINVFNGTAGAIRSLYTIWGRPLYSISINTYHDRLLCTNINLDPFTRYPGEVFNLGRSDVDLLKSYYIHNVDAKGIRNWLFRILEYSYSNGRLDCRALLNNSKRKSKNYFYVRRYRIVFGFFLPIVYLLYYFFVRKCFKDGIAGIYFSLCMSFAYIVYPIGFISLLWSKGND